MKIATISALFFLVFSQFLCAVDTVYVDLYDEQQTILGNGINFEGYHRTGGSEVLASKFTTMLTNLNSQLLRVGMPLEEWEPANDDGDAQNINWPNFVDAGRVANSFNRLQNLDGSGYDLWLAIWDIADWNVKNPGNDSQRRIKNIDEFVESITTYLIRAKEKYGVEPKYVSVNEPSIAEENGWGGYQIALSVQEQAEIILKAGARFRDRNLSTKWLIALHKAYPSELEQARRIYETTGVIDYIAGFDFHGYWWQTGHDAELAAWAEWTATTGLPNFAGECDYDNQFWQLDSAVKARWEHAIETGTLLFKMYTVAQAEGSLLWYGDAPTSSRPYRYANKHFYDFMNPGSIMLHSRSTTNSVLATAFKHKMEDKFAVILQNSGGSAREVVLTGVPNKSLTCIESRDGSHYKTVNTNLTPVDGAVTITLAAQSINTLHGTGGGTPTATFSVSPQIGLPPLIVTFDASASFDPQGTPFSTYQWDFGDGESKSVSVPVTLHTYSKAGTYTVTLEIMNAEGEKATAHAPVYVSAKAEINSTSDAPMTPNLENPAEAIWARAPSNLIRHVVSGTVSDPGDISAQFRALYTQNNLYIRVDVQDDKPVALDNGDRVALLLDFGNEKNSFMDANDFFITTPLDTSYLKTSGLAVQASSFLYETGYSWEFRISLQSVQLAPKNEQLIGLEIVVNDVDSDTDWAQLSWNNVNDEMNRDPSGWGLGQFHLDAGNPPNRPPTVSLIAPVGQSLFDLDASITLAAAAVDSDGTVAAVRFYAGGKIIGQDDNGSDGWSLAWTPPHSGAFIATAVAIDDDFERARSQPVRFFIYEGAQPQVLFLTGDPDDLGNDAVLKKQLEDNNGLRVQLKSGETATFADADGKALIFISESIGSRDSEATFKDADIPLICCESYIYDDLGMTGSQTRTDFGRERGQYIVLQNTLHPLAAGLQGDTIQVLRQEASLSFGQPSEGAHVIATVVGTDKPALFAYEKGAPMVNGTAPAARIGFFATNSAAGEMTDDGFALLDAAIQWAVRQPTKVAEKSMSSTVPATFALNQNVPNPFNPTTRIDYDLAQAAHVTLEVYNTLGQKIRTLVDEIRQPGVCHVVWDAQNEQRQTMAAGLYFYRLEVKSKTTLFSATRKMVLLK
ncbi:PKD domain-containing protein [candidate division KSB1 bacterium]|nr:PKD domain-containing protein [candidate division KSB1 bacterium]